MSNLLPTPFHQLNAPLPFINSGSTPSNREQYKQEMCCKFRSINTTVTTCLNCRAKDKKSLQEMSNLFICALRVFS